MEISKMGRVLRHIGGGEVVLTLRQKETSLQGAFVPENPNKDPNRGSYKSYPADVHILVRAVDYREVAEADVWEFRVLEQHPKTGDAIAVLAYFTGDDIASVRTLPRVAVVT